MTSGKIFFSSIAITFVGLSIYNQYKFKKQFNHHASLNQYRNRLIEFFDQDKIDLAFREMNHYISFGLSPDIAFEILTCQDET